MIAEFERLCALYGYRRIDTPVFEDTELFTRTSGEGSDVVTKEMYTFTDTAITRWDPCGRPTTCG